MVFMVPADHVIGDKEAFERTVALGVQAADDVALVTFVAHLPTNHLMASFDRRKVVVATANEAAENKQATTSKAALKAPAVLTPC